MGGKRAKDVVLNNQQINKEKIYLADFSSRLGHSATHSLARSSIPYSAINETKQKQNNPDRKQKNQLLIFQR